MASILDFLRKKNPNLSLDDARSAMGMAPDAQFNMFGEHVPVEEPIEQTKAPMLSPLKKEVPAEPQIYNEDYDPSADLDIERNPVERPQVQQAPKAPVVQKDTAGMNAPVGPKVQSKPMSSDEFESKPEEDPLEKQYAKEDAEAQATADAVSNDSEGHHLANIKTGFEQSNAPQGPMTLADRFKTAQKAKADAEDTAMWSKIGAQLGGAIGHQSKDVVQGNMNLADMVAKRGERPMQELEQEIGFASQDPGSEYSKSLRDFLNSKFKMNLPDTLSGDQLNKAFSQLGIKSFEAEEARKAATLKQMQDLQNKKELQKEKSEDRMDQIRAQIAATAPFKEMAMQQRQQGLDDRNERQILSLHSQLSKTLNPSTAPASSGIGQANKRLQAGERAKGLIAQYQGNLDKIPPEQVGELYIALNSMIAPGSPSQGNLNRIIPHSAMGSVAKFQEWLKNAPVGANQGLFVENVLHSIESEQKVATEQIRKAQLQALSSHRHINESRPDLFQDLLDTTGINPEELTFNKKKDGATKETKKEESKIDASDVVNVMSPEGVPGSIPRANLKKAIAKGYKEI